MARQQAQEQKKPNTAEAKTAETSVPNAARKPANNEPNKKKETTRRVVLPAGIVATDNMNRVERMIPLDEPLPLPVNAELTSVCPSAL